MANRRLNQFRYSFERDLVDLFANVAIGAAGAPTLSLAKGISSIVRNSAGNYTVLLQNNFNLLMKVDVNFQQAAFPAAGQMRVISEQINNVSVPSMIIQFANSAGTATDPASGESFKLHIICRNAST